MLSKIISLYKKNKEVINYLIFGVLTTVLNFVIYFLLTFKLFNPNDAFQLQIVNVICWVICVCFAYFTNRKYVFDSKSENIKKELFSFVSARLITLFMDMFIMGVGVTILLLNDKIVKIISQIVVIVSNYLFSKLLVFKKQYFFLVQRYDIILLRTF